MLWRWLPRSYRPQPLPETTPTVESLPILNNRGRRIEKAEIKKRGKRWVDDLFPKKQED